MSRYVLVLMLSAYSWAALAQAKINVVTSIPDLAEIVRTIGGDKVVVQSLLTGTEDAHYVEAMPNFIRLVANADVVCIVGLELEVGWMPKILSKSNNSKVQPGGTGYCEAGKSVVALDKPSGRVDRSMGDVHSSGNPHYNLSPVALAQSAQEIAQALIRTKPDSAAEFKAGLKRFEAQMHTLRARIDAKLKPLRVEAKEKAQLIEYHKEFAYFFDIYGIKSYGSIEDKPGVPPSAARLADVAQRARSANIKLAIASPFRPEKHLQKFSELSGIPYRKLPTMIQPNDPLLNSIEKVQNHIADTLTQTLK